MRDIAVIVVNWNACGDLRHCLASLFADPSPSVDFAVWVVDNDSADHSADMVASAFPSVNLIRNPDNRGFSKANNQAIEAAEKAGYRYCFLLNSEAFVVSPKMLDAIVAFGDENAKVGIFGTKVLNPNGTLQYSCRRFPTVRAGFFRNTLLGRLFPNNKHAALYLMGDADHSKPREVDWVSGCAMVIRTEMVGKIGALDERFFMYCEDVDICKRAWDRGWQVWYCPGAIVTHKIGASSDKNAEKMIWEFHRSWELYDEKHVPGNRPIRRAAVKSGLWLRATVMIINRRRAQFRNNRSRKL